jgi:hypothetical protein
MRHIVEYQLATVVGDPTMFIKEVQKGIRLGLQPYGDTNILVAHKQEGGKLCETLVYTQPMVKYADLIQPPVPE